MAGQMAISGRNSGHIYKKNLSLLRNAGRQLETFTRFVETSGQALGLADLEGRIFFVNSVLIHMLGEQSREDAYHHHFFDYYTPESAKHIQDEILPLVHQQGHWVGELNLISKQGRATPIIENIFLLKDYTDKPLCYATVITDISQRVRMEEELRTYHDHLERLVAERTAELEKSNALLQQEVAERKQLEMERLRLAAVLENTSDLVATAKPDGQITYINKAGRHMLGWNNDEDIQAHNLRDAHREIDLQIIEDEGIPTAVMCGLWRGETVVLRRDGQTLTASQVIMAHRGANGEIAYLSTIMRDISESKKTEEALKESEARYRQLFENAPVGIYRIDYKTGKFLEINDVMREYLGFSREELTSLNPYEILTDDSKMLFLERMDKIAAGEPVPETVDYEIIDKQGKLLCIQLHTRYIYDSDGHVIASDVVARDITERKKIEQALQENINLLAEAERIGLIGSWRTDMSMNPVRLSSGLRRIWGLPDEGDVTSKDMMSRLHPEDRDQMLRAWRAAIDKREAFSYAYRIIHPDGTIRHINANSEIIFNAQGKPVGIHGVLQDVTDKKRLEDEMIKTQKLESIGTLAGGLAHDYNNLLAVILGNIELVKVKMSPSDQAYAPLTKAEKAAARAHDLTQQLVTFSKGGDPRYKIMPIQDLLIQSVKLALSGSETKAEWKIPNDLPEARIDENQIRQVIHNIVINAREAMSEGGTLFIEADATTIEPNGDESLVEGIYARLKFRDEGRGISAENITKVFDPFFTTKDMGATKGMGLGLSICYSIMKRHGGRIVVESKESIGTTVTLYLPAILTDMAA